MDDKILQEFYCNKCAGWIIFRLDMSWNRRVAVACPNCGREHERQIEDGHIVAESKQDNYKETIHVPKRCYHKEPVSTVSKPGARDGAIISDAQQIRDDDMRQRFKDYFGNE